MASQCQSYAHRYVGRGPDRKLYEGPCVLEERGHDGEHLPASLAYEQSYGVAFNAGVDAALAKVAYMMGLAGPETLELYSQMRDEVLKVKL